MTKDDILSNWHTMRWVALAIGVFLAAMAIVDQDVLTGLFSAFFLVQALTNSGCMVASSCGVPVQSTSEKELNSENPVDFTEIK